MEGVQEYMNACVCVCVCVCVGGGGGGGGGMCVSDMYGESLTVVVRYHLS